MATRERLWPPSLLGELPSRDVVRNPAYDAVVAAIDALPPPQRDLVNMLFWERLTELEAAVRCARSRSWAHMQKRLALAFVQGYLARDRRDDDQ